MSTNSPSARLLAGITTMVLLLARTNFISCTAIASFNVIEHTAFSGMFLRLFREHGKPVPPGSSSPYIVYHHMVEQGLGVAFTTVRAGKMAGGSVVCVPIRDFGACWDMRIFWRRDKALGENERCFLNFTKKFYDRI